MHVRSITMQFCWTFRNGDSLVLCRYGIFLTALALSILCSEGWTGPLTCLVTLILPPEIKAFGVSLWSALANIIMPAANVLFGIYLMVRSQDLPVSSLVFRGCSVTMRLVRPAVDAPSTVPPWQEIILKRSAI